ncbi:MAG: TAXI family TRAP transporter solute-binding subunit [Desulfosarcina sp.]|nr:TAXI family TRAP transporter solute-binding subunit [Desulfosarcina sp.]MBC2744779.1 TAXI family TRAP transporter solute-binding subunit [Desulfosarcina sp.]MBC2767687.1 TAXI family TRAP transporter solute-binding subunit [Desulfosarcina sp.]
MNRRVMVVAWVMVVLLVGPLPAVAAEDEQDFLGIITGDVKSTAHQIGMDLKALVKRNNIHLAVFNSSGSVENIYAVYQRPGNHLGLVQSDVLAFVAKVKTDPRLNLIADKIKWVSPLYDQEIHILGTGKIRSFSDLHDKRVAIGHEESGTYLTSRLLFEISGVLPRQMVAIGNAQALAALKADSIDAMVTVDGFPVERFALDVSPADGLHLVPITHDGIRTFYPASRIPAGTYPWQAADVDTVSVKTVLVAYDFRNHHCNTIGKMARLMAEDLDWLRFNGHPKWKSVDLDEPVKGWEQYKCVKNYTPPPIEPETEPSHARKPNPVADAIEAVFRP